MAGAETTPPDRPPPQDTRLPPGWAQYYDSNEMRPYWSNEQTGESSWTPPLPSPGPSTMTDAELHRASDSESEANDEPSRPSGFRGVEKRRDTDEKLGRVSEAEADADDELPSRPSGLLEAIHANRRRDTAAEPSRSSEAGPEQPNRPSGLLDAIHGNKRRDTATEPGRSSEVDSETANRPSGLLDAIHGNKRRNTATEPSRSSEVDSEKPSISTEPSLGGEAGLRDIIRKANYQASNMSRKLLFGVDADSSALGSSVPDPVANPIQDGSPPKAASVSEGQRVIYRKWNGCKIQQVIDESTGEVIIHVPGIGEMHATRDEWSLNQRRDDGPTDRTALVRDTCDFCAAVRAICPCLACVVGGAAAGVRAGGAVL